MYGIFDIGGTNSRFGLSPRGSEIEDVSTWKTPMDPGEGIKIMTDKVSGYPLDGVTIALAGTIDKKSGKPVKSPNLPGWENIALVDILEKKMKTRVILENDAACEGLGESIRGAGRKFNIVSYVSVGTGIGGARIVEGSIDHNSQGFEPGHQIIDNNGQVGYWEEFASGRAMEKIYGKPPYEITDPQAWDSETRLLAIGLNNVSVLWSPEVIVLGGSVMKGIVADKLKEYMEEMCFFPTIPEIVRAELGEKSGLYGGLELVKLSR